MVHDTAQRRRLLNRVGCALLVLGVLGATVGAFLPWVYSGAAARNSFAVVRAARRLGVVDSDLLRGLLALWYFVPLFAAATVFLLAIGWSRAGGAVATVLGAVVLFVGLMVAASSADLGGGPAVASGAGAMAALGGLLLMWTAGPRRSGEST